MSKSHWLHRWHSLGGDWSCCIQIGPWWSLGFHVVFKLPAIDISLLFISLGIGRYPPLTAFVDPMPDDVITTTSNATTIYGSLSEEV